MKLTLNPNPLKSQTPKGAPPKFVFMKTLRHGHPPVPLQPCSRSSSLFSLCLEEKYKPDAVHN